MLEAEEERRRIENMDRVDESEKEKNAELYLRAKKHKNENIDEVKNMNQMLSYAKCVTTRDKQLIEKKEIKTFVKTEEKRKDLMLEIERLKKD